MKNLSYKLKNLIIFFVVLLFSVNFIYAEMVSTVAQKGNGIFDLLAKYKLSKTNNNVEYFNELNEGLFASNGGLLLGKKYFLPIQIIDFDGKTIRSTLKISDFNLAKKIETYNLNLEAAKIKKKSYKKDKELWIPFELLVLDSNSKLSVSKSQLPTVEKIESEKKIDYSYFFGNSNDKKNKLKIKDKKLKDNAFYIIAGHGGPDPGAIGNREEFELHEHEYAYDVSIRLAKKLAESGADVYMIVQDDSDGIRDMQILNNSENEKLINGEQISANQVERLKQRTDLINNYTKESKKKHQTLVEIHVDSRITNKRIDIFFYYRQGDKNSEKLNNSLLKTIDAKYKKSQPNRGYSGTVSSRDLYTLRNTVIDATYIELGNIQNSADQLRLIQSNNRQAIANWLYDGLVIYYKKAKN